MEATWKEGNGDWEGTFASWRRAIQTWTLSMVSQNMKAATVIPKAVTSLTMLVLTSSCSSSADSSGEWGYRYRGSSHSTVSISFYWVHLGLWSGGPVAGPHLLFRLNEFCLILQSPSLIYGPFGWFGYSYPRHLSCLNTFSILCF